VESCNEPVAAAIKSGGAPAKQDAYCRNFVQFTGWGRKPGRFVVMLQAASKQNFTGFVLPVFGVQQTAPYW
jgi:hypothetical protein